MCEYATVITKISNSTQTDIKLLCLQDFFFLFTICGSLYNILFINDWM